MTKTRWILVVLSLVVLLPVAFLALRSLTAQPPADLGPRNGRLAPCPSTPNCVSSFADPADAEHSIDPFRPAPGESATELLDRLAEEIEARPRTAIVSRDGGYLHATFTTRVFRFTDDLELLADPGAGVVHVRSASRVGHSDLGVNRDRVEALRAALGDASASASTSAS